MKARIGAVVIVILVILGIISIVSDVPWSFGIGSSLYILAALLALVVFK